MQRNDLLYRASILFSVVTALSLTLVFFSSGRGMIDACYPLWAVCSLVCLLALSLLLRKERSLSLLLGVELGFFLVQLLLSFILYGHWAGWGGVFISLLAWGSGYLICFSLVTKPVTPQMLVNSFDAELLILVAAVLLQASGVFPVKMVFPPAAAALLALFCLMLCRMPLEDGRHRGRVVLGGAAVLIGGGSVAFAFLAARGIRAGIVHAWHAFLALLRFLAHTASRFFEWLFSLFPEVKDAPLEFMAQDSYVAEAALEETTESEFGLIVLAVLISAAVLFTLVWLFRHQGHLRFHVSARKAPIRRSRIPKKGRFCLWLRLLGKTLRYRLSMFKEKDTPQGAFAHIELLYSRKRKGRKHDESCRAFLRRVSEEHPAAAKELSLLEDALDEALFGSGSSWGIAENTALQKALKIQ